MRIQNKLRIIEQGKTNLNVDGILVYYAAHKEHIGFYPASRTVFEVFSQQLCEYQTSKGTIRFPLKDEIPVEMVGKIVRYRVMENLAKVVLKKR